MQSLTGKLLTIGVISLLLLAPLSAIRGLKNERQAYRDQALSDIAAGTASAQQIVGPVLVLPCTKRPLAPVEGGAAPQSAGSESGKSCTRYILPERLEIESDLTHETRALGIYQAQIFSAHVTAKGHFNLEAAEAPTDYLREWGKAYLAFGVKDPRGIVGLPQLAWDDAKPAFEAGTRLPAIGEGLHARLDGVDGDSVGRRQFSIDVTLKSPEGIGFVPVGKGTSVAMRSSWPHPSFVGRYLPEKREVSADGFTASWSTSFFASNIPQLFERYAERQAAAPEILGNSVAVSLIDPVNFYLKTERAMKYGFLFVLLTFAYLLCTEVVSGKPMHPVQYALIGIALAMFFLLLLSLAEHMGFFNAYLLASVACLAQVCCYVAGLLKNRLLTAGFAAVLASLYAVLYVLLSSEDYALLLGSLLLFALLSLVMAATRQVDWYRLNLAPLQTLAAQEPAGEERGPQTALEP